MKIKFKRYDIIFKGHKYCILVPERVDQLWITNDGYKNWSFQIEGNEAGLQAILYATVILGFNPKDKIIYFPIRNNGELEYEKKFYFGEGEGSYQNRYDMIFSTHQVPLCRSKWKDIRKTMPFIKSTTYVLDYEEKRTVHYFEQSLKKWKQSDTRYRKEKSLQIQQDDTLFVIYSRMQFRQIFLGLNEVLHRDLEVEFERNFNGVYTRVYDVVLTDGVYCPYRTKKCAVNGFEIGFYDRKFETRVAEVERKRQGRNLL